IPKAGPTTSGGSPRWRPAANRARTRFTAVLASADRRQRVDRRGRSETSTSRHVADMAKRKFHRDFSHELGLEIMARGLLVVLAFLCALPAAAMAESTAPTDEQAVDPKALKIIQAMSDRLAGAKRLSFRARAVYDVPGKDKTPIYYATMSDVYFA